MKQDPAYLSSTTTCGTPASVVDGLSEHPRGSQRGIYARMCIRTSENSYSTHSGE